jgi:hypothetical protein
VHDTHTAVTSVQLLLLLHPSAGWAGLSSDISFYLNSHHIDVHAWLAGRDARPVRVTAAAASGARHISAHCLLLTALISLPPPPHAGVMMFAISSLPVVCCLAVCWTARSNTNRCWHAVTQPSLSLFKPCDRISPPAPPLNPGH